MDLQVESPGARVDVTFAVFAARAGPNTLTIPSIRLDRNVLVGFPGDPPDVRCDTKWLGCFLAG